MRQTDILWVWLALLRGRRPFLSIEVTRECPLRCSGCYAFDVGHLGALGAAGDVRDLRGQELVDGVVAVVERLRPAHLSLVGGEPLVRWRELDALLQRLNSMGQEVQLVTSAVRPLPSSWAELESLHVAVSVDGLRAEHDARRSPATYERILRNIAGHKVIVHCTITPVMLVRQGYLEEFVAFWSERPEARKIWFSLFTPQEGTESPERLTLQERDKAVEWIAELATRYPRIDLPPSAVIGFKTPPNSPEECAFAQLTECLAPDLVTRVSPCQLGGRPLCRECGCLASAGMSGFSRTQLAGIVSVWRMLRVSQRIGRLSARLLGDPLQSPRVP